MSIRLINPDPVYTDAETLARLRQEYDRLTSYMVEPPSFESWARSQLNKEKK